MAKKIIIDTDPGIDDAMAIAFANASPEIELMALTTVFGNIPVRQATTNALILKEMMGLDIPVAEGSSSPLVREARDFPAFVHGTNGFGDVTLPTPVSKAVDMDAASLLVEMINQYPDEITIVGIGPLTNLARAVQQDPGIQYKVKGVVLMGGAVTVNGNVTPAAEANMFSDPHAADIVFTSNWPVTMVGLDVTHQIIMTDGYLRQVHKNGKRLGEFLFQITRFYLSYHRTTMVDGLYTHDPTAVGYVIEPDLFKAKQGEVRVSTEGISIGQTIMNFGEHVYTNTPWNDKPKSNVCLSVNSEGLLRLYAMTLSSL